MSGTSLDGLDISLIDSDGLKKISALYNITYKYSQQFINDIKFLISNDLVDIYKFFNEKLLVKNAFIEIFVLILSKSMVLSLIFNLGPTVFAFISNLNGSKINFTCFKSIFKSLFKFWIKIPI